MLECLQIYLNSVKKARSNEDSFRIDTQQCAMQLEELCKEYLKEYDDVLTFECDPKYIDSMILLLSDKDLTLRYDISQVSNTLYKIALKDLEL